MKEAEKMRNSPEFKASIKKMQNSQEFKKALKDTNQMMQDPNSAARVQAQMEHMLQRGQNDLKKQAKNEMAEAMEAMYSNPDVLQEAKKLVDDPDFHKYMNEMTKDPAFKNYINAVSASKVFLGFDFSSGIMSR